MDALADAASRSDATPELLYHLAEAQLLAGDPINARLTAQSALAKAPDHAPSQQLYEHLESLQRRVAMPAGRGR